MKSDNRGGRRVIGVASFGVASAAAVTGAFGQQVAANDADKGLETVVVTGRKANLDLMPQKILDTPQSINVIPAQVIREQGVNNLQDALKNVPGITLNAGEGGTHGDLVNLRGFPAGDDYFMDGLRDTGLYDRDTFDIASVEVYKGPASTLFGRGSTGGVINQVTKSPELFPIADMSVTGGTNSEMRVTGDVNYVLDDTAALRVAAMAQTNGVEGRPYVRNQRWGIAPSVAWGLGTDTTVTLKYLHQQEDNLPDYGIPFVFDKPVDVPRDTYYGLPGDDRYKTDVEVVTGRIDHKFNEIFSVSNTSRFGSYWFDSRQTAAIYGTANCFDAASPDQYRFTGEPECTGADGDEPVELNNPLYPVLGTPLDKVWVLRDRPSSKGIITTMMNETDLTAKFDTGAIKHTLILGAEFDSEAASLKRFVNVDDMMTPQPLLDPDPLDISGIPAGTLHQTTIRQAPITQTRTFGVFAADTIELAPEWTLTAALRFDHFTAHFDQNVGTATHFHHVDNIVSPRAALVYKPAQNASVYFSYGTSFNPSAENLSLAANNKDLGPERDRTFEVGGKVEVMDGMLALTAAAFNTEMTNARITDPTNPGLQALSGEEHVNGFELNAQGRLTPEWSIIAGYTYLDPTAVGLAGAGVHGPIPNTSHNQANLWTTYDFDELGLEIGTGLNYLGRVNAGTDAGTVPGSIVIPHVPSHVTWDAMAGYKINDTLSVRVNAYNLTDEYYFVNSYFTRPNENHTVPGAGRTVLFTLDGSF